MLALHLDPLTVAAFYLAVAALAAALHHRRRIVSDLRRDWEEIIRRASAAQWILEDLERDLAEIRRLFACFVEFLDRHRLCFRFVLIEKGVEVVVAAAEAAESMYAGVDVRATAVVAGSEAVRRCDVCGEEPVRGCSRFRGGYYCSGKCLIFHWSRGHRHEFDPSRVEVQSNAASDEEPRPNSDNGPIALFDESRRRNLNNVTVAQDAENSIDSVAYRSKLEELHNIFDEIESSFSTSQIKREDHHSTNNTLLDSSLNLALEAVAQPEPQLIENISNEGFEAISTKLDQLITEMITLQSEPKIC